MATATKCDPIRCGRGCTQEEYDQAVRDADKLVEHLGEGWQPSVSENLGWHASALSASRTVTVYGHMSGSARGRPAGARDSSRYVALLGRPTSGVGEWVGYGDTPKGAVGAAVTKAKAHLAERLGWLEGLEE